MCCAVKRLPLFFMARHGGKSLTRLAQRLWCAVLRHGLSVGASPIRQLSLRPVATGAVVEVTKRLKPLV